MAETRRILAASPAYLERHGRPVHPGDLRSHALLLYVYANNPYELTFSRGPETIIVPVKGLLEANDGQILRAAALKDLRDTCPAELHRPRRRRPGRLEPVLDDWDLPRLTVNIAYPSRKHLSAKVRSFIDFMVEQFETNDFARKWTARHSV